MRLLRSRELLWMFLSVDFLQKGGNGNEILWLHQIMKSQRPFLRAVWKLDFKTGIQPFWYIAKQTAQVTDGKCLLTNFLLVDVDTSPTASRWFSRSPGVSCNVVLTNTKPPKPKSKWYLEILSKAYVHIISRYIFWKTEILLEISSAVWDCSTLETHIFKMCKRHLGSSSAT